MIPNKKILFPHITRGAWVSEESLQASYKKFLLATGQMKPDFKAISRRRNLSAAEARLRILELEMQ